MAKVELLKNHVGNKKGDVIEVTKDRANYLQRVGAAKEFKAKPQTKELKTKVKTKAKS